MRRGVPTVVDGKRGVSCGKRECAMSRHPLDEPLTYKGLVPEAFDQAVRLEFGDASENFDVFDPVHGWLLAESCILAMLSEPGAVGDAMGHRDGIAEWRVVMDVYLEAFDAIV
jgi:hypothetical protein